MGFTISIIAKPYVKRFIEVNCGNPADLSKYPVFKNKFKQALRKPEKRRDTDYSGFNMSTYSSVLEIQIKDDEFYRYGWELSRSEMVAFNRIVENYLKMISRNYLSAAYALNIPLKTAIEWFQEEFKMTEDDWSYEAIKKDFFRHAYRNKQEIFTDLQKVVNEIVKKILLANMSHTWDNLILSSSSYEHAQQNIG